jgi:hypothetical protein
MAIGETQKLRQKFLGSTIDRSKRQLDEFLLRLFCLSVMLVFSLYKGMVFQKSLGIARAEENQPNLL